MSLQSVSARPRSSRRFRRHSVICADCNESATVPFRPNPDRPVYCRPCFNARRNDEAATPREPLSKPPGTNNRPDEPIPSDEAGEVVFPDIALKAVTRRALSSMNISQPTPIQTKSIPPLLDGRDLIGQARTGSGKTLAFVVPLSELCDPSTRRVQALILVPTRELAIQVAEVTKALCSSQRLRVTLLYGGRSAKPECAELRSGAQVIIGTPGRTLDHLRQGTLDLRSVRFLVLDEADEMLDRGFARDVEAILSETPSERQTALLSATLPEWVATTARKYLRNPVSVEVDSDLRTLPTVEHLVYTIRPNEKIRALQTLLDDQDGSPVIVFGRTKHGVKKLARQLDTLGYSVGALQGNLSQNARERVMKEFRSGATPTLVATNVAARGLDIDGVSQVINFDLPDTDLLFTHRVGRTGRMGRSGEAVTFVTPDEERKWKEIERGLGRRFSVRRWSSPGF